MILFWDIKHNNVENYKSMQCFDLNLNDVKAQYLF